MATEAASRIFQSRIDGNLGYCGIGRARCWNPYDATTIEKNGLAYHVIAVANPANSPAVITSIVIPETLDYMKAATPGAIKYAGYVVEYLGTTGTEVSKWIKIDEVTAFSATPLTYTVATAPAPWVNSTSDGVLISINGATEGTLFRVRINVTPEINIVSGCTLNPGVGVVVAAGTVTYEGATYAVSQLSTPLALSSTLFVGIQILDAPHGVVLGAIASTIDQTNMTLTGINVNGTKRFKFYILGTVTTDGAGAILTTTAFQYANIANEAWYTQKHSDNLTYWAGINEAGFLNSSAKEPAGSLITAVQAVKNRMLITYPGDTQLWGIEADQSLNAFIDRYDFGTRNPTTLFYNRPVICTQRGIRAFDLTGLNFQSLDDLNIGERIQNLGKINVLAPIFWPWYGSYVAFAELTQTDRYAEDAKLSQSSPLRGSDTKYGFLILSYSKESEMAAWSWCPVAALTTVFAKMQPIDDKLYFRSENTVYYMDANAQRDVVDDTDGQKFVQRFTSQFSHLGKPGTMKRTISISKSGDGYSRARPLMNPYQAAPAQPMGVDMPGHLLKDTTHGKRKIPFTNTGVALSVEMESIDAYGMTVDSLSIDYKTLGK